MPVPTKSSNAPATSLTFLTIGGILTVLSGVSFFFFTTTAGHEILGYVRVCAFLLGLGSLALGFGAGRIIGLTAQQAQVGATDPQAAPPAPQPTTPPTLPPSLTTTSTPGNARPS